MNFLAHAYLSFDNPNLLIGNLIADLVKGKQINDFPQPIQQGIRLHRAIDSFTDSHTVVKETKHLFHNSVGRYGSSFLDVAYDHYLAIDKQREPENGWQLFADNCYHQIEAQANILPPKFLSLFMYMKSENWLYNYRHRWMIEKSFDRLKNRAAFLTENADAFGDFEHNYKALQESYDKFFPDLEKYVKGYTPL